jgi:tRNA modification GTPase
MDTIFALASGRGKAGVAVIRLSGPAAHAAVGASGGLPAPTAPRRAASPDRR